MFTISSSTNWRHDSFPILHYKPWGLFPSMPLLAVILSLKLNISGLLWLARRPMPQFMPVWAKLSGGEEGRPPTPRWVERWGSVITLYWCPRVWIYLNATQLELSSKCEHWHNMKCQGHKPAITCHHPPSLKILISASFVWMFENCFSYCFIYHMTSSGDFLGLQFYIEVFL